MRIAAIIPLYNGARFIRQSLTSVLSQTRPADEIIVVDDGSTDDGPAIVEGMAAKHPIRLLRKPNGGQSSARNFGVAHATSELIGLLDQDDAWYSNHLRRLEEPFLAQPEGAPLGFVYSNMDRVGADGTMERHSFLDDIPRLVVISPEHPKRSLVWCLRTDMFVLPSASLILRDAFDAVGGFDESLIGYEDDDLFLRLFAAGYDNVYLPERLHRWRIANDSCSYSPLMARSRIAYAKKLIRNYPEYARDHLVPRFVPQVLGECSRAARNSDGAALRSHLRSLETFLPHAGGTTRLKLAFARRCLTQPFAFWTVRRLRDAGISLARTISAR
jgi:glycosyltransferase involved in cell wall biosynthesis